MQLMSMAHMVPKGAVARSPSAAASTRKYEFIDALRGWAVFGVLMIHAGLYIHVAEVERWTRLGMYGVQLFFVTSAVTLCLSWQSRASRETRPIRNFFVRRFFRIAPMFWLAIVAYRFVPSIGLSKQVEWLHVLVTAVFCHGWFPPAIYTVVPGGWSVAVEMSFYCLFPLLLRYVVSLSAAAWWILGSLAGAFAAHAMVLPLLEYLNYIGSGDGKSEFLYHWFPSQFPVFLIGFLTYQGLIVVRRCQPPPNVGWLLIVWSLLLMLSLKDFVLAKFLPRHVAYSFAFGLLFLGLSIHPTKLLVNPVTCYLGKVSFSAYLTHFAVLEWSWRWLSGLNAWNGALGSPWIQTVIFTLVALPGTVAISTITYHLIEAPGIRMGRDLLKRWETAPSPA